MTKKTKKTTKCKDTTEVDSSIDNNKIVIKKVKKRRKKKAVKPSKNKSKLTDFIFNLAETNQSACETDKKKEINTSGDEREITHAETLAKCDIHTMFQTDDETQLEYIEEMDEKEVLAMKIAIDHLGSSFSLHRSIGFNKFKS